MSLQKTRINIKGKDFEVNSVKVGNVEMVVTEGFLRHVWVNDEWFTEVDDPEKIIGTLKKISPRPDYFTFIQRVPDGEPRFPYYRETESWAVLPVSSFDHWWKNQIKSEARNRARQAGKRGVVMKRPDFDDAFVEGMVDIFNETPVRQGKPFWHYGKDFETVKNQFSRYLFRESLIGAYYEDKLIGFIMLGNAGKFAVTGQIISKIKHRDKCPNNALIAEAIRVCEEKGIPYLCYTYWDERSLGGFKKKNGFERFDVPRYYVPLTVKGKVALSLNLHRGFKGMLPERLKNRLKDLRNRYYNKKSKGKDN